MLTTAAFEYSDISRVFLSSDAGQKSLTCEDGGPRGITNTDNNCTN